MSPMSPMSPTQVERSAEHTPAPQATQGPAQGQATPTTSGVPTVRRVKVTLNVSQLDVAALEALVIELYPDSVATSKGRVIGDALRALYIAHFGERGYADLTARVQAALARGELERVANAPARAGRPRPARWYERSERSSFRRTSERP